MSRSTALVLTPRLPWPLDDGGRIVAWQSIRAASQVYETALVSLVPEGEESAPLPDRFAAHGIRVVRVSHRFPPRLATAWGGLFGRWPYTLARYRNPELPGILRRLVAELRPRFAIVNHLHMATYIEDLAGTPVVFREHNLEYLWMKRYAERLGLRPAGLYARTQVGRLKAAESSLVKQTALALALQEDEAKELRALAPSTRVEVLPVGVDLAAYGEPHPGEPPVVLLAGSFAWAPNVDGAIQFLSEGWARVTARVPRARLRIVGKNPPRSIHRAADRLGVEVAGYVDSFPEELANAAVFVVPLWVGAGVRVKIVEALAARVPVAATRLAAEGLGLTPGEHYAAGDTPGELGSQVATLLLTPAVRDLFRERGRALAETRWGMDAVARTQNSLCASMAEKGAVIP